MIRQVTYETLVFGLRYQFVTEGFLLRLDNMKIPFEIIHNEIVRQLDEMPSLEFH